MRSLKRALDRRLYLLLYGSAYGAHSKGPVWHFPEKVYENEDTLRLVRIKNFMYNNMNFLVNFIIDDDLDVFFMKFAAIGINFKSLYY